MWCWLTRGPEPLDKHIERLEVTDVEPMVVQPWHRRPHRIARKRCFVLKHRDPLPLVHVLHEQTKIRWIGDSPKVPGTRRGCR